ncbi:hypothetical protein MKEN_00659400 [Mycena kentingensis (nom. inval.)]|nr:hypothetical protein MKEN_00659400 [Mycena kentingensis (nom. inval.)]
MPSSPIQDPTKKEKKTRRRLRLSCVECTKRRQRCDRQLPCGLCVSRGVQHLCRWENTPFARPTPARPPVMPGSSDQDTIHRLTERIATLENTLRTSGTSPRSSANGLSLPTEFSPHNSVASLHSPSSGTSPYSSPEPYSQDEDDLFAPITLSQHAYERIASLAQNSVAHYGEFVGSGGPLSTLYSISAKTSPRVPHVGSTQPGALFMSLPANEQPNASITRLVQSLPSNAAMASLCQIFFRDYNWRYGIPPAFFQTTCAAMWNALRHPHPVYISPHWLCLLFAVLAVVPDAATLVPDVADQFFSWAMTARRIADGSYLSQPSTCRPSAAQGGVLSILAVPLLCDYLAERGHVSEAWKLVGHAVVSAEALGLHRDPSWWAWHRVSEDSLDDDEKLLRRRSWWGLVVWERMYGLVLGRPVRAQQFDVTLPATLNADGRTNVFNVYQREMIHLFHLAGEINERCFGVGPPTSSVVHDLDRKLDKWETQLPPELRSGTHSETHPSIPEEVDAADHVALARQRYTLTTWYLLCRMKLHISFLTNQDDAMFFGVWEQQPLSRNRSRRICISLASDLVRIQCSAHTGRQSDTALTGANWGFVGCLALLEGGMALGSQWAPQNWHGQPGEPDTLVQQAMMVLAQVANEEPSKGAIARLGSEALETLIQEVNLQQTTPTEFVAPPFHQPYEWFSGEYGNAVATKEVPRYMSHMPQMLMYEDSKAGLLDSLMQA